MDKIEASSETAGTYPINPVIKKTLKWGNSALAERLTFKGHDQLRIMFEVEELTHWWDIVG